MFDVSVIIPFKDNASMTIACLESLIKYGEPVKEILLISNNSSASELATVKNLVTKYSNAKVMEYNEPFNFQAINNWGITKSSGNVIFMLNNDIELNTNSTGLIEAMYKKAIEPKNGAIGCVLLYEDGKTIQHGGVYLVAGGTANHLYTGLSFTKTVAEIEKHTDNRPDITKGFYATAVTAAAVMVERQKIDKIKGMNEAFIIGGGDVDLCLRLEDEGYKTYLVGSNHGYMLHKESKSRSALALPYSDFVESYKSYIKHFDIKKGDPYFTAQEISYAK